MRLHLPLLLLPLLAVAQDTARIDEVLRHYVDKRQFMGNVLIARGVDTIFQKSYGTANAEWQVPNDAATKFRLGSITKQFTAAAVLLLEERGKLSTTDLISKHLPNTPPAWEKITVHHLLNHTSGIPSFTALPAYNKFKRQRHTIEELVNLTRDKPLEFEPGSKYAYSNSGYALLGQLLETISGKPYGILLDEMIFKPLGMSGSGYDSNTVLIPHRALGYSPTPNGIRNADFIDMSVPHAAGALYSTTGDLLRWTQALVNGKLLKSESLRKMLTPGLGDYGYGIVIPPKGRKRYGHGGGIDGFNTAQLYYPESGITVIAFSNLSTPVADTIANHLGAIVHNETVTLSTERKDVPLTAAQKERLTGDYAINPNFTIRIFLEDGQLLTQATNQPMFPLFATDENTLFLKVVDAVLAFPPGEAKPDKVTLNQNGQTVTATRK
jgi:CubicO group peptidase (beta-lactamase class C family)